MLYRLDADLAHLLVDEAQDTSPAQWQLIEALTAEFFSGDGADEKLRTLFAVGDEKQSIFGFQGAEPRAVVDYGRHFSARARAAGACWEEASFEVSRRSTAAVLESVDLVFQGQVAACLTADGGEIHHEVHRIGEAGLVEVWPPVKAESREAISAWEPFAEEAARADPCTLLAGRIAKQIRHWLDSGEILVSENRPVTAGDILILVRKRKPFADRMVKALKDQRIPVAGADRMRLTEQLAVMDLMVLGDFLLLPEDDLALATLLKTPFFGFDDDDLFAIGHGRAGSLWQALYAKVPLKASYADAAIRLEVLACGSAFRAAVRVLCGASGARRPACCPDRAPGPRRCGRHYGVPQSRLDVRSKRAVDAPGFPALAAHLSVRRSSATWSRSAMKFGS